MKKTLLSMISVVLIALLFCATALAVPSNVQYSTTKSFLEVLDSEGIHYICEGIDSDNDEVVKIQYGLDDNTSITVKCYLAEDGSECNMRVWNLIDYDIGSFDAVVQKVDEMNRTYRWTRFYTDPSDNSVTVAMDVVLRDNADAGDICREALRHIVQICDDAYPSVKEYDK